MFRAIEDNDINAVKLLLEYKADINIRNKYNDTALILASRYGHTEIVKLLLKAVDVNIQNYYNNTALISASIKGHIEIVKLLLGAGAYINIKGEQNKTAIEWASGEGHTEIVKLLHEYSFRKRFKILHKIFIPDLCRIIKQYF